MTLVGVIWLVVGFSLTATGACQAASPAPVPAPSPRADILEPVRVLASEELEGRAVGTAGGAKAADYLARQFAAISLEPLGDGGGFLQRFEVKTSVTLGPKNALSVFRDGRERRFAVEKEFVPFTFSDTGEAQGAAAFVGYGISAPELGYDDYAGLEVKGRVVVALTHEPREKDQAGPFRKPEAYRYTEVRYKALNAREHGAKALLLVHDPVNHPKDALFALRGSAGAPAGLIVINASRTVAEAILSPTGQTLGQLQAEIDRTLKPRSCLLPATEVSVASEVVAVKGLGANVVGRIAGTDPKLRDEAVVLGAHHDGLGRGGESSLAPDRFGQVHPGADDNASGVAGVIAAARHFKQKPARRSVVFVCFDGEETGVLGSAHYVRRPPWPLAKTFAMVNLDSIGRLQNRRVYAHGVDSAKEMRALVDRAASDLGLELKVSGDAYGPSDHTSFYLKEKPVVFFFTGPHSDYHRPTDTADRLAREGLTTMVDLATRVVTSLADRAEPLTYVKTAGRPPPGRGGPGGYGAFFGSIPDFSDQPVPGVKLTGVRAGSPAEKAGVKAGDLIVKFGDVAIRNLHDLTFALKARRPGDTIEVRYLRDGKECVTRATLEERK
ncbi:MAG: M20/M25/M40 family metallo-hydrolase [Candidatus Riflebacteria bacterium]|nr:M20/M25/M40 family metallo-hydrolase [Candidatus Riflebacteria bacterium]